MGTADEMWSRGSSYKNIFAQRSPLLGRHHHGHCRLHRVLCQVQFSKFGHIFPLCQIFIISNIFLNLALGINLTKLCTTSSREGTKAHFCEKETFLLIIETHYFCVWIFVHCATNLLTNKSGQKCLILIYFWKQKCFAKLTLKKKTFI